MQQIASRPEEFTCEFALCNDALWSADGGASVLSFPDNTVAYCYEFKELRRVEGLVGVGQTRTNNLNSGSMLRLSPYGLRHQEQPSLPTQQHEGLERGSYLIFL